MKQLKIILPVLVLASVVGCKKTSLNTDEDKFSYAVGHTIGKNFKAQNVKVNYDAFRAGVEDTFEGKKLLLDEKQIREALKKAADARQAEEAKKFEANKKKGEEFLAKNAKKEGFKVTKSGLQYKVLKAGKGPKPKKTSIVKVHYEGKTIDGEIFDSSKKRGTPAEFPLNGVIPGWTEGVQLMPVGSVFKFVIPSDLAYGARGAGAKIPPHSVLTFEVELLEIVKKK